MRTKLMWFLLRARGATDGDAADPSPETPPAPLTEPPTIDAITFVGAPRTQVSQGTTFTLAIAGHGLGGAAFTLDAIGAGTVIAATRDAIAVQWTVPHGAAADRLGSPFAGLSQALTITAPGGTAVWPQALVLTAIAVSPNGDDTTGMGTIEAPYRTITHALAATHAQAGDVIQLAPGAYRDEEWPLVLDHVTLQSVSANQIAELAPGAAGAVDGVEILGATMRYVSITGFAGRCVFADADPIESHLDSMRAAACGEGLSITGATVVATGSSFEDNGDDGIIVGDGGSLGLERVLIDANHASGLLFAGRELAVADSEFTKNTDCVTLQGTPSLITFGDGPPTNQLDCSSLDLHDMRASGASAAVHLRGAILHGAAFAPGAVIGMIANPPYYDVEGAGNELLF